MRKILLAFFAVVIIAGACDRDDKAPSGSPDNAPAVASPAPEPKPAPIIGEERKPIVAAATRDLKLERDKIEKISFYFAKSPILGRSGVEAYISLPDDRQPLLRTRMVYFGEDWVFYNSVKVMVDDAVIYERDFSAFNVVRDNSGGSVWETVDFLTEPHDLLALHAIANAKSATIRFSGRERRHDHEITAKERGHLKKILDAYQKLATGLVRKLETTSA